MGTRTRYLGFTLGVFAAVAAAMTGASGKSRNFIPDVSFDGTNLRGWTPAGGGSWKAANGEFVGTPGTGAWLVLDTRVQDVAVSASFFCAPGCAAGVLLRAARTPDGGLTGTFVSLAEQDLASYHVTIDAQGRITSRQPLRPARGATLRSAPPLRPGETPEPERPAGAAPPAGAAARTPALPPAPQNDPIPRPAQGLQPSVWNTIEIIVDANLLRGWLNDTGGVSGGVAEDDHGNYGLVALYAGGTADVRFKDVGYKDLQPRVTAPETVSPRFRMQTLNEFYYSWGPSVADVNRDKTLDIVAGPYYYLGPDYLVAREIYLAQTIDPATKYFNGVQYAYDFTGDGWPDVVNAEFLQPLVLYVNPKGESRRWDKHIVAPRITSELVLLRDLDADGTLDLIYKDDQNRFVYAKPDVKAPTATWPTQAISEAGRWPNHGMGVGDVNGDGRVDFLNAHGWWEQPAARETTTWIYHAAAFGRWTRSGPGGAEIAVYDVNGDGLNDVVTSLQAHGWGLSWFEQQRAADGARSFVEHPVMGDFSTENAGGVTFSQLHGAGVGDIDGDGTPDFVTGKRFWSHLDTYLDPDPHGAPVLYVYRTVRKAGAPGGAELVPELVHNRSGAGSNVEVRDLNGDGAVDLITSTRRGTFIFWNQWRSSSRR